MIPYEDMPSVRFDSGAAQGLVRELDLTAQALVGAADVMEADLTEVTADWRGRFRHTFDYESARHDLGIRRLAETLKLTAVAVRAKEFAAQAANRKLHADFMHTRNEGHP